MAAAAAAVENKEGEDKGLALVQSLITAHADFPSKGVVFRDIFPVFRDPVATEVLFTRLVQHVSAVYGKVDVIVGLDSRGFLFGPTLATRLGAAFVPIRKKGKLPGKCLTVSYQKEYGKDEFDIQVGAIKPKQTVVLIDDLLATGGTLQAAIDLVERSEGVALEALVIIELDALQGRKKIKCKTHALLHY